MTSDLSALEPSATVIDSRAVRAGCEDDFSRWVERANASAREADGHVGSMLLGQTEGLQHLVHRFRDAATARAWQASDVQHELAARADDFSVGLHQFSADDPACFELPSDASAAKWKRFVSTWIAVFPVLLAISTAVRALLKDAPQPVQLLFSSLLLTATLQWIILPRLQRWTRFWLLQGSGGKLRKGS